MITHVILLLKEVIAQVSGSCAEQVILNERRGDVMDSHYAVCIADKGELDMKEITRGMDRLFSGFMSVLFGVGYVFFGVAFFSLSMLFAGF